jgi:acetoacetate decarboxylase
MPLNNPAFPPGPYKFYNREFIIISYRTDPEILRALVPEPLEVIGDTVNYEFIRMPDSTGFGDYTETGQVIPVRFKDKDGTVQEGGYVHAMYLDDEGPDRRRPRDLGIPQEARDPEGLPRERDAGLHAALRHGALRHRDHGLQAPRDRSCAAPEVAGEPNFMIKIIPHVDCTPRVCELVRYYCEDVTLKGAWAGPAHCSSSTTRCVT